MKAKTPHPKSRYFILFLFTLTLFAATACQRGDVRVFIEVDHGMLTHRTLVTTVGQVLQEANIELGDLDRVKPDLYVQIQPEMKIQVIRVTESTEVTSNVLPYEQRVVINEALPTGEQRLAQLGVNGEEVVTVGITYEDGQEVSRTELSRVVSQAPIEEILVVGGQSDVTPITFDGVVTYLSGGNAWLMKENNTARRLLTTSGDLDGHVFSFSPNAEKLIFTRATTDVIDAPLNELWMVNTRIVGEKPISLPVQGVLYAEWSPIVTDTRIAYSTAERVASQPGWRANNDLWLWDTTQPIDTAQQIIAANTKGLYPWWGTNFAWSPNGEKFAFTTASEISIVDAISGTVTSLMTFAPYETHSDWVWVPTPAWSPNSKFIATVAHGKPLENEAPEASQVFDLWLFATDGSIKAKVTAQSGMWSNPHWYENGIIFAKAVTPLRSATSRYTLINIDWDGSNPKTIFPVNEELGLSFLDITRPPKNDANILVYQDNLYLLRDDGTPAEQLTSDNQSRLPRWAIPPTRGLNIITSTETITATTALTLTPSAKITSGTTIAITPTVTLTPTIEVTSTRVLSKGS